MGSLDQITQLTAALVEERAVALDGLKHHAALLCELVNKFQLTDHGKPAEQFGQPSLSPRRASTLARASLSDAPAPGKA